MTALLTPEQIADFHEAHQLAEAMAAQTIAHEQRGLLLRDREEICERLEAMASDLRDVAKDDNSHALLGVANAIDSFVSELRGGK